MQRPTLGNLKRAGQPHQKLDWQKQSARQKSVIGNYDDATRLQQSTEFETFVKLKRDRINTVAKRKSSAEQIYSDMYQKDRLLPSQKQSNEDDSYRGSFLQNSEQT